MPLLNTNFFDDDLRLNPQAREEFVNRLWPDNGNPHQAVNAAAYFLLVDRERSQGWRASEHAVVRYEDVISIVDIIRANAALTFAEIVALIKQNPGLGTDESKISRSVELSARLWLMTNIRRHMTSNPSLLQSAIPWVGQERLASAIDKTVKPTVMVSTYQFSEYLNVVDMARMGGLQVVWTSDLKSHLTMEGSSLCIFHNTSVLRRMLQTANFPLPPGFIRETLRTINLLMPLSNAGCNTWLAKQISSTDTVIDPDIYTRDGPATRNLADFPYWCDRLGAVDERFKTEKPGTVLQWLHDRRDMERWWTFWLVVVGIGLTVFFGLVQSITGILQVALPK